MFKNINNVEKRKILKKKENDVKAILRKKWREKTMLEKERKMENWKKNSKKL